MTNGRDVLAFRILGGTVLAALAIACTFGDGRMARAESPPLALDVYTADTQGIGVTSTLIYGEHEAILVDTQFRISGADTIPADIQIPQPWPDTHFTVDGQSVDVIAGLQGDVGPGPRNNVVWVPSLAAAIVGDIAFNQVHLSLRATDAQSRKAWRETLRLVQERHPRIVVAGHKNHTELPDTPDVL